MKKQVLSAIIAAFVALSTAALPVFADGEINSKSSGVTNQAANADTKYKQNENNPEAENADEDFQYVKSADGIKITKYIGEAKDVTIPDKIENTDVVEIAENAFADNKTVVNVAMSNTVTSIGKKAFSGCDSLNSIRISSNVQEINESTFENCVSLTSVNMPDNLVVIYGSAFSGCSSLTRVRFPDTLQYFGEGAFYNCTSLNAVTIPKAVNDLNGSIFGGCTSLFDINVSGDNPYYLSEGNVIYSKDKTKLVAFPGAHSGTYAISEGTQIIGYAAFYKSNIESVTLPQSLNTIENAAFVKCEALTSIEIPSAVTSIGGYAFSGCSALKTAVIPDSVTKINEYTFANCSALERIVIPSSVSSLGENVFSGCRQDCVVETNSENSQAAAYAKKIGMDYKTKSEEESQSIIQNDTGVKVIFNGELMEFESAPRIEKDNTIVPMRALFEKMGAKVLWNQSAYIASASLDDVVVNISIGSNIMWRNGTEIEIEAPAVIIDDFTFVPLRAVSEAFGADVEWNGDERTVYITFGSEK